MTELVQEYYLFEMDQLEKDQQFLQLCYSYDYQCIRESVAINEASFIELVKQFFKFIIQKIKDLISFVKGIFTKVVPDITKNIVNTEKKSNELDNILRSNSFTVKNKKKLEMSPSSYRETLSAISIGKSDFIAKGHIILGFFDNAELNKEKIKLNTPIFTKNIEINGYLACIGGSNKFRNLFHKVLIPEATIKPSDAQNLHQKSVMKELMFQSIFLNQGESNDIEYGDIIVDHDWYVKSQNSIDEMKKGMTEIKKLLNENEKESNNVKKEIESIERKLNEEITEDIFKAFRSVATNLVTAINYNKDMILNIMEITTQHTSYLNSIIKEVERQAAA